MQINERKELKEGLIKVFNEKDISNSIEKFVNAIYENNGLCLGIREGHEFYNVIIITWGYLYD